MALPQPRFEQELTPAARKPRRAVARVADPSIDSPVTSPARTLQAALMDDLMDTERKWPPAASLGFILVTCGGFWLTVGYFVSRWLHHAG